MKNAVDEIGDVMATPQHRSGMIPFFVVLVMLFLVSCDDEGSTDTNLSDLRISVGNLNPAFDPSVREYTVLLPPDITAVDITAIAGHSGQTLR